MIKGKEGIDFNFYSYARLNVDVLISVTDTKNLSIVLQKRILRPCQKSTIELFCKYSKQLLATRIFVKNLHHRSLTALHKK